MSPLSGPRIYLDHAATTSVDPQVKEAMLPFLGEQFGNPSSLHYWGRQARKALEQARETIAACLRAKPNEIIFTSGATEADNMVLFGLSKALWPEKRHLITTQIEHAAVANACESLQPNGWEVTWLPVDEAGLVSLDSLKAAIRPDTALVSIIHGNNEVGTIQPIEAFGAFLREQGILFHTDAVQTIGKLALSLSTLPVDYLSISAHKFYGPKGAGALYIREGSPMPIPLLVGGGQEANLRSGTENLAGIVGMAKALQMATDAISLETPRLRHLQEFFIQAVLETVPTAILNGPQDVKLRVPGNVHFSFPPAEGEALVLHLDLKGIAVSSGSACHSAVIEPSRVVKALGKSDAIARATVRFSMGKTTTKDELIRVVSVLPGTISRFKK